MPWALIEAEDEKTGDWFVHIVPVVDVNGFDTKEEAESFLRRVEAAGEPCVTDGEGNITATYFGHILSPSCPCGPKEKEADPGCYIHRQAQ